MSAQSLRDAVETNEVGAVDVLYTMWQHLALELAINMTIVLAAIPVAVAMRASLLLAVPIAALCQTPFWMGAFAVSGSLLDGCATVLGCKVTYSDFLRAAWGRAGRGWALAAVPTFLVLAVSGTLAIASGHPHVAWLAVPLLVDGALLIVLGLAGLYVFPLGATTSLPGPRLWIGALACAATAPSITVSSIIVVAVLTGVTALLGPGLLVAWPAPLALYLTAMGKIAAGRLERRRTRGAT